MEENITLILADGTIIDNLTINGNNLISQTDVGEDKLSAVNLSRITINGTEYRDMLLRNYWKDTDGWHIVISEITPQERLEARINAKIDYIAMMEDLEL